MATYPNLNTIDSAKNDEEHVRNDSSDDSSDDGDMYEEMLECYYDEYGQLIQLGGEETSQPEAPHIVPTSNSQPLSQPRVQSTSPPRRMSGGGQMMQKQITLTKDSSGKLGIRLRRMGNSIFFAYVDMESTAARKGIGFGDQLVSVSGVHLPGMTGSSLMRWIAQQKTSAFQITVTFRPYDFTLTGIITSKGELQYSTRAGKLLGSVKLEKVCIKGHVKHLQLLEINGVRAFGRKPMEILQIFKNSQEPLMLRVMPRIFVRHLLKGQEKERIASRLHFSSPTAGI